MGMRDVFDMRRADLSGIDPKNNVFVSDVFHKAFIGIVAFLFLCLFKLAKNYSLV